MKENKPKPTEVENQNTGGQKKIQPKQQKQKDKETRIGEQWRKDKQVSNTDGEQQAEKISTAKVI